MAILNLSKFKNKGGEEATGQQVPDELPPLPGQAPPPQAQAATSGQASSGQSTPSVAPPAAKSPPPVSGTAGRPSSEPAQVSASSQGASPAKDKPKPDVATQQPLPTPFPVAPSPVHQHSQDKEAVPQTHLPKVQMPSDDKLYFSELIARFHEQRGAIDAHAAQHVIAQLEQSWQKERKLKELADLDGVIEEKAAPLRQLEKEWRMLKDEIADRAEQLREKEEHIIALSAELKKLLLEKQQRSSAE